MPLPETTIDLRSEARLNYIVSAGQSWNDKLTITTTATPPVPISLVGSTCSMVIKRNGVTIASLSIGSGLTVGGVAAGTTTNELYFYPPVLTEGYYDINTRIQLASGLLYLLSGKVSATI